MKFKNLKNYAQRRVNQYISIHFKYFGSLIGSTQDPEVSWTPDISKWAMNGFHVPSPPEVKRAVLKKYGNINATWIETGTYLGATSAYLSEISNFVFTIEPSEQLFQRAKERYSSLANIEFIHGTSEDQFESTLLKCTGNINLYLDGHYSEGETYQAKMDTPLDLEVDVLIKNRSKFKNVTLFVDDVRCLNPQLKEYRDYPSLLTLLRKLDPLLERVVIEHDILIAFFKPNDESRD